MPIFFGKPKQQSGQKRGKSDGNDGSNANSSTNLASKTVRAKNKKDGSRKNSNEKEVHHAQKKTFNLSRMSLPEQPPPPYVAQLPPQKRGFWPHQQSARPWPETQDQRPQGKSADQNPKPHRGIYDHAGNGRSCSHLPAAFAKSAQCLHHGVEAWQNLTSNCPHLGTPLCGLISSKFDTVMTLIDGERFSGDERELVVYQNPQPLIRGGGGVGAREVSRGANNALSTAITGTNYFAKANLYANARLPEDLPPMRLYMPTYPLLCLAAQFSLRVYTRPSGAERETHVDADWRLGTKAMVVKSVPIDDMNTVIFAIRGSQTFMDWAVNLHSAPASPEGFLDDPGNLCHSGFLSVAKKMVKPVAARLRSMLEEDPSRASSTLLMTGHSAGGAVAILLYAHMMAKAVTSELNVLAGCFKRIHCITFGAPPISLLPIERPPANSPRKSLFLSFINEGDPVPRADKAYVRSLLDLYATPSPGSSCLKTLIPSPLIRAPTNNNNPTKSTTALVPPSSPKPKTPLFFIPRPKLPAKSASASAPAVLAPAPVWPVPPCTLSNAGRLVLLRTGPSQPPTDDGDEDVRMCVTSDAQLRPVVFGDPLMHMMKVYARRIEVLATRAVTARIWS